MTASPILRITGLLLLLLQVLSAKAQSPPISKKAKRLLARFPGDTLQTPESMVYLPKYDVFLASDVKGKQIVASDRNGENMVKIMDSPGPMGLKINGKRIYFAEGANGGEWIRGLSLRTLEMEWKIRIPEAAGSQLNDLTSDGKNRLWVSDRKADKIYEIMIREKTYRLLSDTEGQIRAVNGLWYDKAEDRLLTCNIEAGKPGKIYSVSLSDGKIEELAAPPLFHLDGIVMDKRGNVFVSGWGEDWKHSQILKYKAGNFREAPEIIHESDWGVADLGISSKTNSLLLPCWWKGTLKTLALEK